jgi:hypothetical protein
MITRPLKNRFYVMVARYKVTGGRYKPVPILVQNLGRSKKNYDERRYYQVVLVKYLRFKPEGWTDVGRTKEEIEKFGPGILVPLELIIRWQATDQQEAAALALAEVL